MVFTLAEYWEGGYNAGIKITNTGDAAIENWGIGMEYSGEISKIWNAEAGTHKENYYVIKNAGWNQDIPAGGSVEFGISGQENFPGFPKKYKMLGKLADVKEGDYSVSYEVSGDWGSGFTAKVSITNNSGTAIEDWVLEFDYDREITQIWNADIESHEGNHYVVKNAGYNSVIKAGETVSFGFNGCKGTVNDEPHTYSVHEYNVDGEDGGEDEGEDGGEDDDYQYPDLEDWDSLKDTDGDGIPDEYEEEYGTDWKNADTDGDGLKDGYEVFYSSTDPTTKYTDPESGIADGEWDFDGDGLNTLREQELGTDCYMDDTDSDLLKDGEEVTVYGTDPSKADTDGDTLLDGYEIRVGLDPLNPETFGYPDAEYKYEYVVEADNPILKPVNEDNEQYQMSFSVKGSGGAISEMRVRESAYAQAIQQEYTLGCIPEILLLEEFEEDGVDSITLNFEINESYIHDEYSAEELKGIRRYNVFKFDEDGNFLCPVNTTVDTENHCIRATVDEIGTYCILDMELWFCEIGFEVDGVLGQDGAEDSRPALMGLSRGGDGKQSATEGGLVSDDELVNGHDIQALSVKGSGEAEETPDREMVDIAFCINNNVEGLTTEEFQSITKNILQICRAMEYESKSVRFYIIDQDGEVVRTSYGCNYASNLTQISTMVNTLANARTSADYVNRQIKTLTGLGMREDAFKTAVFFGNSYLNKYTISLVWDVVEADIHCLAVNPGIQSGSWYDFLTTQTEGEIFYNYYNFTDGVLEYIYGYVPDVPDTVYHTITSFGLNTVILKDTLTCGGSTDTDGDGLTDWEETDQSRVTVGEDGKVVLPTLSQYLGKYYDEAWWYAGWSKRYRHLRNKDGVTLEQMMDEIHVLPLLSDPTSSDGDGDGILDADEIWDEDEDFWDGPGKLLGKPSAVREDTVEKMYPQFALDKAAHMLDVKYCPSYLTIQKNNVTMTLKVRFKGDTKVKARDVLSQYASKSMHQLENHKVVNRLGKDCTLKDLAIDGIKARWNGVYKGTWYDFREGMKVNFSVKVIEVKEKSGRYIEVDLKSGVCGRSYTSVVDNMGKWKPDCNRIVTMYTSRCSNKKHKNKNGGKCETYKKNLRPFVYYEGVIAHEFGHVMGLKDMYANADCNHGYEPKPNEELEYMEDDYGVPGAKGIMLQNGSAVLNDIEMIVRAFKEKQWQYYVPYGDSQCISLAIGSEPRYIKGDKTYKWNFDTCKMEEVR